jgi:hypothetical protein
MDSEAGRLPPFTMNAAASLASMLPQLEDELFYAILDVALDIDQVLAIRDTDQAFVPTKHIPIRYPVLSLPSGPPEIIWSRYVRLREKGLVFLKTHGAIAAMERYEIGVYDGWMTTVSDMPSYVGMLKSLKTEHGRRSAGEQLETNKPDAIDHVLQLTGSFHRVALGLRDRRAGREPLVVEDEYDLQYVLAVLLESRFDDVRREEWTPSYAGGSARVDFFLKNEGVFVETKMTRDGLTDRKLGEELTIDIARYKERPDCEALVCFVYDPNHRIKNPRGIENDLSKQHGELVVVVTIRPQ